MCSLSRIVAFIKQCLLTNSDILQIFMFSQKKLMANKDNKSFRQYCYNMESMDRLLGLGLGPSNNYQFIAREIKATMLPTCALTSYS